jgi:hypothetical protein
MSWIVFYSEGVGAPEQQIVDLRNRDQAQVEACRLHFQTGRHVARIQGPNGEIVRFEAFRDQCVRRSSPIPRPLGPR